MQRHILWTAVFDYYGTGEGRTIGAWIGYAADDAECRLNCGKDLAVFVAQSAVCVPGVARNEVTKLLWSEKALEMIEHAEGLGNVVAFSQLHFNFA